MITNESLLKAFGEIRNEYIIEEYEEKSTNKRKNNIRNLNFGKINTIRNYNVKKLSVAAIAIIAIIIASVINMNNNQSSSPFATLEQITNPITEVYSIEEMKKYLGFNVPLLNKEVENYFVIGDENYANHARIVYKDETEFNMEKGSKDVSGIYGATIN